MNKKYSPLILFITIVVIAQLACNTASGGATPNAFATLNGLYTASALTMRSGTLQPTLTPGLPQPTLTGIPFFATQESTLRAITLVSKCDAAQFVSDVTYADGSIITRGTAFVKIWRIRNVGTCSWTTAYTLVFAGGDLMNGPVTAALTKNVNPGETIDIQASFVAPNKDGDYRSYWKLSNASGVLFGIGDQADTAFWVDVKVTGASYSVYEFAPNYCSAVWENKDAALPCPGTEGDANGFALRLNAPVMENGETKNEPALLVSPQDKKNGIVSGQYPGFTVQAGDRFSTIIGCQYGSESCNVVFRLDYKHNGQIKTLGTWYEVYEGLYYPIDLDLSSLAGQTVKFILVVGANGGNDQDDALWLDPRITRQGTPPPTPIPTFTFTPTATVTPTFTPTATQTPSETPTP
jgi:hypothetical protein